MEGFLGFLLFLFIAFSGFWLLLFLSLLAPYWLLGGVLDSIKSKFSK